MSSVFQRLKGQHRGRAFGLLGFTTLGRHAPERQHDTCEFIDFVHWKLLPRSLHGVWQGRRLVTDQPDQTMACTEPTPLSKCIGLIAPPKHNPDIQRLMNHWSAQEHPQAMIQPMPWLFLQLPRFRSRRGRIRKSAQWYDIPSLLEVPLFLEDQAMDIRWLPYKSVAIIRHHGTQPYNPLQDTTQSLCRVREASRLVMMHCRQKYLVQRASQRSVVTCMSLS